MAFLSRAFLPRLDAPGPRRRPGSARRFTTVPAAILERPPSVPPGSTALSTGIPCWRAVALVYACSHKIEVPPTAIGSLRVYSPEFAELKGKVAHACRIVKTHERSRGQRSLLCGEHSVAMSTTHAGECSGSFYLEFDSTRQKKLV